MSSIRRSEIRHVPDFKIDKVQLEAVRDFCDKLSEKLSVDFDPPSGSQIQGANNREERLGDDVGQADVQEREDLETSGIYVDDNGAFAIAIETPAIPWEKKNPRSRAGDRGSTIGDKTGEQLLRGRKYLGSPPKGKGLFVVTVHSCTELSLPIEEPLSEAIVKADIKPPGHRHPHVRAREMLLTDSGSRLAFCITYTRGGMKKSSYVTSKLTRAAYRANSFVHWMEGEDVAELSQGPDSLLL
jgi:hypothetical protein